MKNKVKLMILCAILALTMAAFAGCVNSDAAPEGTQNGVMATDDAATLDGVAIPVAPLPGD